VEKEARTENVSVYLYKAEALYEALDNLRNDNAQGEYYLTDTIKFPCGRRRRTGPASIRVRQLPLEDPRAVMAFNSPDELLAIEDYLHRKRELADIKRPPCSIGGSSVLFNVGRPSSNLYRRA